jgi:conjugal transfer pilus assembly protein TraB
MKTLKLKELWEENKAIRSFLLVLALAALVMVTITLVAEMIRARKLKKLSL